MAQITRPATLPILDNAAPILSAMRMPSPVLAGEP